MFGTRGAGVAAHIEKGDEVAHLANIRVRRSKNHFERFPIESG
jgi:hypothetical protein